MKKLFLILTIVSIIFVDKFYAQEKEHNPDGERISLHVSPFFNSGSFSGGGVSYNYESVINFDIRLKIPIGKDVTLVPFWEQRTFEVLPTKVYNSKVLDKQTKAGMTVSIYF